MPELPKPTGPRHRALHQEKPGQREACAPHLEKACPAKHNPSTAKTKTLITKIKTVLKNSFFSKKKEGIDFLLSLHPAIRNLDVMARAQAALLDHEEGHPVGG